ncbi:MAG: YitT family protein [Clostridia bacterium]|nr:YitT family protein [Clostridia bacterium]
MQKNKKKVPSGKHAGKLLFIRDFLLWTFGAALYSIGVASFTTPSKFVAGGVTGLAVLVNHLVPFITTGMVVIAVNIPLFILAWKKFGFRFIARTVAATVTVSLVIDFIDTYGESLGIIYNGDEKLLAAVFGGILCGAGIGIVFLGGATTGGIDILARFLRIRFAHIPVGKLIMICDFIVVMLSGIVYKSIESILFSLIVVFLASQALDFVVSGRSHSKLLFIMTSNPDEAVKQIISECGRGVSVLPVQGGYTGENKKMLMCVVRAHEVALVRAVISKYDENPFIIVTDSSEVLGNGFKSHKDTL